MFCYSGLNFQDLIVRQGAIDSPPKTPFILGFECAGEIEQVGEGVTNFKVCNQKSNPNIMPISNSNVYSYQTEL